MSSMGLLHLAAGRPSPLLANRKHIGRVGAPSAVQQRRHVRTAASDRSDTPGSAPEDEVAELGSNGKKRDTLGGSPKERDDDSGAGGVQQMSPPSPVTGPRPAGEGTDIAEGSSLQTDATGVSTDSPGSAPEDDAAGLAAAAGQDFDSKNDALGTASGAGRRRKGGLLPLTRSEAAKRAAQRAERERQAVTQHLKDAKSPGIAVTVALTYGAIAIGQVMDILMNSGKRTRHLQPPPDPYADQGYREDIAVPVSPVPSGQRASSDSISTPDYSPAVPVSPTPDAVGTQRPPAATAAGSSSSSTRVSGAELSKNLQSWQSELGEAVEGATRSNAEAAQQIGSNLGEWATDIGRLFSGQVSSAEQAGEELGAAIESGMQQAAEVPGGMEPIDTMWRRPEDPSKPVRPDSDAVQGLQPPSPVAQAAQRAADSIAADAQQASQDVAAKAEDAAAAAAAATEGQAATGQSAVSRFSSWAGSKLRAGSSEAAAAGEAAGTEVAQQTEAAADTVSEQAEEASEFATEAGKQASHNTAAAQQEQQEAAAEKQQEAGRRTAAAERMVTAKMQQAAQAESKADKQAKQQAESLERQQQQRKQQHQRKQQQVSEQHQATAEDRLRTDAAANQAAKISQGPGAKRSVASVKSGQDPDLLFIEPAEAKSPADGGGDGKHGSWNPAAFSGLPWQRNQPATAAAKRQPPQKQQQQQRSWHEKPAKAKLSNEAADWAAAEAAVKATAQSPFLPARPSTPDVTEGTAAEEAAAAEAALEQQDAAAAAQPAGPGPKIYGAAVGTGFGVSVYGSEDQPGSDKTAPAREQRGSGEPADVLTEGGKAEKPEKGQALGRNMLPWLNRGDPRISALSGGRSGGGFGGGGGSGGGGGGSGPDGDNGDGPDFARIALLGGALVLGAAAALTLYRKGSLPYVWGHASDAMRAALVAAIILLGAIAARDPLATFVASLGAAGAWLFLTRASPLDPRLHSSKSKHRR